MARQKWGGKQHPRTVHTAQTGHSWSAAGRLVTQKCQYIHPSILFYHLPHRDCSLCPQQLFYHGAVTTCHRFPVALTSAITPRVACSQHTPPDCGYDSRLPIQTETCDSPSSIPPYSNDPEPSLWFPKTGKKASVANNFSCQ